MRRVLWPLMALAVSVGLAAQSDGTGSASGTFDVVSIKPVASVRQPRAAASLLQVRPGSVRATGITAQGLISLAYPTGDTPRLPSRIDGGPDWLTTQAYEFIATVRPGSPDGSVAQHVPALLRRVLSERFKLRGHLEMRPVPLFALVLTRRDGALGPLLRRSSPGAEPWSGSGREYISAINMTMGTLASRLTGMNAAGRVVVDRTGLAGGFDLDLYWSPERTAVAGPLPPEVDGPALFTAMQEQLGLKLEPRTEPQDVYVVDSIERPDPN